MPIITDGVARNPAGRIDLKIWPHTARVYLNRAAAEDLIKSLQSCLSISTTVSSYLVEFKHAVGGTSVVFYSDDDTGSRN